MKKILIAVLISISLFGGYLYSQQDSVLGTATRVFTVQQGGTGASSFTTGECLKGNGTGAITTGACGGSSSVFPFTPTSWGNSTSTTIGFFNGLMSTASSTFNSTLNLPALSDGGLSVFGRLVSSGATTTAGAGLTYSSNSFVVDNVTATMLNSEDFGGFTCNGTSCAIDYLFPSNSLIGANSAGTALIATGTAHALTVHSINATTTSTSTLPRTEVVGLNATSFVTLMGETFSNFTTYVRSLFTAGDGLTLTGGDFDCDTASGTVFGCLTSADWTTFNNKQATITAGDALTLTGTDIDFDGGTAPAGSLGGTWASPTIDDLFLLNNGDVGTGVYDFGGATSFEMPNSTDPTVDAAGEVAVNTTVASSSIRYYDGTAERSLYDTTERSFFLSTSTIATFAGAGATTTYEMRRAYRPQTLLAVSCTATTTGTAVLDFGDGTNWSTPVNCNTTGAFKTISSNNTFIMGEMIKLRVGTIASLTQGLTISYVFRNDPD